MTDIIIEKRPYEWLFGGLGFHNSEATMYQIMQPDFLEQRVLKSHYEISPTFSRVFAGYADWSESAMDSFAEYYKKTLKKTDTTIYAVPGRIPLHETHEEMEKHAENVAEKLEYLVKEKNVIHIRYYCITNELSVGNTYALLSQDMDRFKEYQTLLWRAFRRHSLNIGLAASDGSGFQNYWQVDWCSENMDEITDVYCTHNYETGGYQYNNPEFYETVYKETDRVVQIALQKQKRYMLGEFGVHDGSHFASPVMRSDVFAGFGNSLSEAQSALQVVVHAIAAINAGTISLAYWSFCDYPDPMLKDWSDSDYGKKCYEVGRFSGHGTDIRYNKNGLFRWDDENKDYSSRPFLYSIGLLARYFRRNARVMYSLSSNRNVLVCAVRNRDSSISICIVNLSGREEDISISLNLDNERHFRRFDYQVNAVPFNDFNDLQHWTDIVSLKEGKTSVTVAGESMIILTDDYVERIPSPIKKVTLKNGMLSWTHSKDEEHCYYRVYKDKIQIASTVNNCFQVDNAETAEYLVTSVDKYGNEGDKSV